MYDEIYKTLMEEIEAGVKITKRYAVLTDQKTQYC